MSNPVDTMASFAVTIHLLDSAALTPLRGVAWTCTAAIRAATEMCGFPRTVRARRIFDRFGLRAAATVP